MVFYRKYRPQTIDQLDSEHVRKSITALVSSPKIAHAFLFMGPKGLGKTSAARILAKIVNCEEKGKEKPCNKCQQCISITNGTNLDVLEIDGASNRGIDEIRDLREKIKLSPLSSKKKVYIIDEVHMLTTEAFNALLKTLEEPPEHVLFILATTESQKIPPTIVSRCFIVNFEKPTTDELMRSLTRIVKDEKLNIEKEALLKITELSDGSFRDGSKFLEQAQFSSMGKRITETMIDELHHVSHIEVHVIKLIDCLAKKDTSTALQFLNAETAKGLNNKIFMEKLLEKLHKMLLKKVTEDIGEFGIEELKKLLTIFNQAAIDMKYAVIAQLPLELAIIEYCVAGPATRSALGAPSSLASSNEDAPLGSPPLASPATKPTVVHKKIGTLLQQLIEKVKPLNHSIAGVLRGCSIKEYDNGKLIIETTYAFHKERLSEQKVLEVLERATYEISGKKTNVSIVLSGVDRK